MFNLLIFLCLSFRAERSGVEKSFLFVFVEGGFLHFAPLHYASVEMTITSHRSDDFLKCSVVVDEIHFHLFDARFAFVIRIGLGVEKDGNHLVGESVFRKATDAHVPFAELLVKRQQPL